MSENPLNLGLRFVLELAALAALGYWGWSANQGIWRFLVGIGAPLLAAVLWGALRVPGDPGEAPIAVPGPVRLALELGIFGAAVWLLAAAGQVRLAWILGGVVALHYLLSYDRIVRLLTRA